jgi:MFS family permease
MSETNTTRFGPATLQIGISKGNGWALMYASFVSIGLATGIATLTPYILTANLGITEANQGKALGTLAVVQEIVLIFAFGLFGALADKIGRRPVYVIGMLLLTLAYLSFPYGRSMGELALYRIIFALGIGAATGMLATVISDYAVEGDRGKLTALCGFLNGLGIVLATTLLGKLPAIFVSGGTSEVDAGRTAMAVAGSVALVSAIVLWFGLKPGLPPSTDAKKSAVQLLREGVSAAKSNRRIAVAYCAAFVARGDIAIVGLFAIAWGKQAAMANGLSAAEALSKGIIPFVIAQSAALLWPAVIAVPLDRMHRMKALSLCMLLGMAGYCLMAFVRDPLLPVAIPFFVLLGIGQISAFLGAQTLIGKEAPEALRGSVIGLFNFSGAVGILILTGLGGWMFDSIAPWSPFLLVGILNGVVALLCWRQYRAEGAATDTAY